MGRTSKDRRSTVVKMAKAGVPLPDGADYHFFLSHYQATGGDQGDALSMALEHMGDLTWYDNQMDNLTKEGMEDAVCRSAKFVLFLSEGVLQRDYVQFNNLADLFALPSVVQ